MTTRWREEVIRSAILFGVAVVLVAGFWVHREFYQFGFYPLLVAGGFATFLVMAIVRYAIRGEFLGRSRAALILPLEDGERLVQRRATLAILPADTPIPKVGATAVAKFETGPTVGRFRLADAYRKMIGDLNEDEVRDAGFRTVEELRRAWSARTPWRPDAVVLVARLEPAGKVGP
jgi:hypothetical protein